MPITRQQFPGKWEDGACIFCGSLDKKSEEHYWGQWLENYLPPRHRGTTHLFSGGTIRRYFENGKIEFYPEHRKPVLNPKADPSRQSLKVVCERCNNDWMSRLQSRAKPILIRYIEDDWTPLSNWSARSLASWITMFCMVYEFADAPSIGISPQEREGLRLTLDPLPNWRIWVGRYRDFGQWHRKIVHRAMSSRPFVGPPHFDTHITTFALGKLVIQALSTTDRNLAINYTERAEINRLAVLWPFDNNIFVKPTWGLKDIHIDRMAQDLHTLVIQRALRLAERGIVYRFTP
ncbi:MAG: hypothetical protein ACREFD_06275 [Stellaceae bacterium]